MSESRNVHQRKLAVMAAIDIKPDKKHPHHGYDYVSIQNVSDTLRKALAKEGLDYEVTFPKDDIGWIEVALINADEPSDRTTTRWPIVPDDKAWAYTVKYPLVRLFLVGDGEEPDESQAADASARTATSQARRSKRQDAQQGGYDEPAPELVAAKDPLEGLPVGFTIEQWTEVKDVARGVKAAVAADVWTESGLDRPARVKARIAALYELPDGEIPPADRALYAYETIRGELEALMEHVPTTQAPGRAASPSGGKSGAGVLSQATVTALDVSVTPATPEELRQQVAALG